MPGKGKSTSSSDSLSLPRLLMPQLQAENQTATQIEEGKQLLVRPIESQNDLKGARAQYNQWDDYNRIMLRSQFDSSEIADGYSATVGGAVVMNPTFQTELHYYHSDVETKLGRLQSLMKQLHFYDEGSPAPVSNRNAARNQDIFVVHGHDKEAVESVARFIERLDLRAVILQERASGGRTVIEKFEEESSGAGYAVVLLTPDDIGAPGDEPVETKRRARQNVIFELGFFVGRLGRDKVSVLHKGDVDIPSDYQGVIYVAMGEGDAWEIPLAREMKEAGIDFDPSKVLES